MIWRHRHSRFSLTLLSMFPYKIQAHNLLQIQAPLQSRRCNRPTISFIIFWDFSMFYQIFLSLQVKRFAIITHKHGIYELPYDLTNDSRLRILGNQEISRNCLNFISLVPSLLSKMKVLLIHSGHPPPLSAGGGGWASNQIFKKGEAWQDLSF